MEGLIKFYREGIKSNLIKNPLGMFFLFFISTINIYTTFVVTFIVISFVIGEMNKKSFNILTILPIKTKNIIEVMYVSIYLVIGIGGLIGTIIFSVIFGESFSVKFVVLSLMLIMVNLLVPENFSRGMNPSIGGWFGLMAIFYGVLAFCMITGVEYTNLKNIISEYSLVAILSSILLVGFSLKSSYDRSIRKIYG
ncbi:MAG: hypothetical protein ACRC2K_10165 [Clostridium sp.]